MHQWILIIFVFCTLVMQALIYRVEIDQIMVKEQLEKNKLGPGMTKFLNYAYSYRSWVKNSTNEEVNYCDYRLSAISVTTDSDFTHGESSSICKGMLLTIKYSGNAFNAFGDRRMLLCTANSDKG